MIESIASSGYYTKTLSALRGNSIAMNMLGEPLRVQTIKLNDRRNRIDNYKAKVGLDN